MSAAKRPRATFGQALPRRPPVRFGDAAIPATPSGSQGVPEPSAAAVVVKTENPKKDSFPALVVASYLQPPPPPPQPSSEQQPCSPARPLTRGPAEASLPLLPGSEPLPGAPGEPRAKEAATAGPAPNAGQKPEPPPVLVIKTEYPHLLQHQQQHRLRPHQQDHAVDSSVDTIPPPPPSKSSQQLQTGLNLRVRIPSDGDRCSRQQSHNASSSSSATLTPAPASTTPSGGLPSPNSGDLLGRIQRLDEEIAQTKALIRRLEQEVRLEQEIQTAQANVLMVGDEPLPSLQGPSMVGDLDAQTEAVVSATDESSPSATSTPCSPALVASSSSSSSQSPSRSTAPSVSSGEPLEDMDPLTLAKHVYQRNAAMALRAREELRRLCPDWLYEYATEEPLSASISASHQDASEASSSSFFSVGSATGRKRRHSDLDKDKEDSDAAADESSDWGSSAAHNSSSSSRARQKERLLMAACDLPWRPWIMDAPQAEVARENLRRAPAQRLRLLAAVSLEKRRRAARVFSLAQRYVYLEDRYVDMGFHIPESHLAIPGRQDPPREPVLGALGRPDPRYRTIREWQSVAAHPPDMLINTMDVPKASEISRTFWAFDNRNRLVADSKKEYQLFKQQNPWTPEEVDIFRKKFVKHPKLFHKIAQYLPNKTVTECIAYYHLSKQSVNYRTLGKKQRNAP